MLSENIKSIRKSKGLSQEELAVKLNVVRQTVSKWEKGLSVPDSDTLIDLSKALDTPVCVLLGEPVAPTETNDLKAISEKLEVINLQLAQAKKAKKRTATVLLCLLAITLTAVFILLIILGSPYSDWDYSDPEKAVAGVLLHAFEWVFVRLAPPLLFSERLQEFA